MHGRHIGSCRFIWPCIKPNNWIPRESSTCLGGKKKSNQMRIISIIARVSSWVSCQQKAGDLCHLFLSKPHFSNMADLSQSKHFLWKCETLQLNLSPWTRESSLSWETKCISHREDCDQREGVLSGGKIHWRHENRRLLVRRRGGKCMLASEDLPYSTDFQSRSCARVWPWDAGILLSLKYFLWQSSHLN